MREDNLNKFVRLHRLVVEKFQPSVRRMSSRLARHKRFNGLDENLQALANELETHERSLCLWGDSTREILMDAGEIEGDYGL